MSGPTFDNRGMRYFGGPRSASKKLDHSRRAAGRRRIMPGYPIETVFKRPEDVWEYLNGDRITCLRCGKSYKALPTHLPIHGWTAERYQEFYGLPWRTGLTSSGTKQLKRKNGIRLYREGIAFGGEPGTAYLDKAYAAPRRKRAPYLNAVAVMNVSKTPTRDRRRVDAGEFRLWLDADYWRVLGRMKADDRAATDVCGDPDMPGTTALWVFARARPDFSRALEASWEALSFPVQASAERLGRRFKTEGAKLRLKGMTSKEIGRTLGVHWVTVVKYLAGVPCPEKTHCPQGHSYPVGGPKQCKICNTEQARISRGHLPRAESAKVRITVACSVCGKSIERSRLRGKNRKARCRGCHLAYHREYDQTVRRSRRRGQVTDQVHP